MKISITAPAKINLSLDALYKREDGYHEVEMVMTTIDLADRLYLERLDEDKIVLDVKAHFIPEDRRNLIYQAALLLKKRFDVKMGVRITIDKHIPVSAGLAGGSSDAAAALKGLNVIWELGLSIEELAEISSEIGSDIAFCVYGGTALAKSSSAVVFKVSNSLVSRNLILSGEVFVVDFSLSFPQAVSKSTVKMAKIGNVFFKKCMVFSPSICVFIVIISIPIR
nr:4-(cytidine 5'-diphospho)-2-C-methyl-D-erythritol kinase [Listeria monocytogenes]